MWKAIGSSLESKQFKTKIFHPNELKFCMATLSLVIVRQSKVNSIPNKYKCCPAQPFNIKEKCVNKSPNSWNIYRMQFITPFLLNIPKRPWEEAKWKSIGNTTW